MRTKFLAIFFLIQISGVAFAETEKPAIGYTSVSEALEAERNRPGASVTTTEPDKWIIVSSNMPEAGMIQWSFTPNGHYAHPSVAKRVLKIEADGNVALESTILCEADKAHCDKLVNEFTVLNEQIRDRVQNRLKGAKK